MAQIEIWNQRYAGTTKKQNGDEWIHSYADYFVEKKECTVIDLGCGKGSNAFYLKERGFNVIACDFSPIAIRFINDTNSSIETRCLDMTKGLPRDLKDVGVILASLSTHYFSLNDTITVYKEIYDTLEPLGYFIFRVNSMKENEYKDKLNISHIIEKDYYQLNDGTTKRYFTVDSISELLKNFSIINVSENNSIYHGNKKYYIEGVVRK